MEAIEFKTVLKDGKVTIPIEYSTQWEGKPIRVIVLEDVEQSTQSVDQSGGSPFQAVSIKTSGFKFDRAEANAR
jgi:uncharacterized membrane protein